MNDINKDKSVTTITYAMIMKDINKGKKRPKKSDGGWTSLHVRSKLYVQLQSKNKKKKEKKKRRKI